MPEHLLMIALAGWQMLMLGTLFVHGICMVNHCSPSASPLKKWGYIWLTVFAACDAIVVLSGTVEVDGTKVGLLTAFVATQAAWMIGRWRKGKPIARTTADAAADAEGR